MTAEVPLSRFKRRKSRVGGGQASLLGLTAGLIMCTATPAVAQVRVYDGPGVTWQDPANWSPADVPDSPSEDAVFENNTAPVEVTSNQPVVIRELRYEPGTTSRTIRQMGAFADTGFDVLGNIANSSGNPQSIELVLPGAALRMHGTADFLGNAVNVSVGPHTNLEFFDSSKGTNANVTLQGGVVILATVASRLSGGTLTLGALSGYGNLFGQTPIAVGALNTSTTFSGNIGLGANAFIKIGTGTLTLVDAFTNPAITSFPAFTGPTHVLGGQLAVNGMLGSSPITVGAGATLSGTGPIGGLTAQAGSTVSPGNIAGTLNVNGNIVFQASSTYRAEIAPTVADNIQATGGAQLAGTLELVSLGGSYVVGSQYVLVDAANGRTGTFDSITGLSIFGSQIRGQILYSPTQVRLLLASNLLTSLVGSAALTSNQRNFTTAYDAAVIAGMSTQPFDALHALSGADLAKATDQLSGGLYPSLMRTALEHERLVREAVLDRLASTKYVRPDGIGLWAQGIASWGEGGSDLNAAAFDRDSEGFVMGVNGDGSLLGGTFRAGVFGHYIETDLDVDALASRARIKRAGGGGHFGMSFGRLHGDLGMAISELSANVNRIIAFPGLSETATSRPEGTALQAFGEFGYSMPLGTAIVIEPYVAASFSHVEIDDAAEAGAIQRINVAKKRQELRTLELGLRGQMAIENLRLAGRVAGQHWFGDLQVSSPVALNVAPQQPFQISAAPLHHWGIGGALAASIDLGSSMTASVGYSGVYSDSATDQAATATIAIRF